jgi:hypothetical protein
VESLDVCSIEATESFSLAQLTGLPKENFDTQEEWDAHWERMAREDEENFYIEVLKYLRGEPNDIRPGTAGMIKAEIAKKLVENDPARLFADQQR